MAASDVKREFLGQPVWVWAVAGAATLVAAIYLYRRNAQHQAGQGTGTGTAADGAPYQSGVGSLYGWLLDHQSSPATTSTTTCPPGYVWSAKHHRCYKPKKGAGINPGGPVQAA